MKWSLSAAAVAALLLNPAYGAAQQGNSATARPLSEGELLRTIDSLGTGDPARKAPLGATDLPSPAPSGKGSAPGAAKEKGPTEITAREATFDQKTRQAVFIGQVIVKDPEFNITCDRLTALLRGEKPRDSAAVPKPPMATPPPAPQPGVPPPRKGGGLERAIAEGSVVIVQEKLEPDGTTSRNVGRAAKADYDATTGDIILTGWPQVQQGFNTCIALEEGAVMTLNRERRMKVTGLHKTVIKENTQPDKP